MESGDLRMRKHHFKQAFKGDVYIGNNWKPSSLRKTKKFRVIFTGNEHDMW